MMAQMKVHGISDKVMELSSPRTIFLISLEPVKVFCQICPTRFFNDQKDPVFQGLSVEFSTFFFFFELFPIRNTQFCTDVSFCALIRILRDLKIRLCDPFHFYLDQLSSRSSHFVSRNVTLKCRAGHGWRRMLTKSAWYLKDTRYRYGAFSDHGKILEHL